MCLFPNSLKMRQMTYLWVLPKLIEDELVRWLGQAEVGSTGSRLVQPRKGRKGDITKEYL